MCLVTAGVGVSMNVASAVGGSTMASVVISTIVVLETGVSVPEELGVVAVAVAPSDEAGSVDVPWSLHALSARSRIGAASQDFFIVICDRFILWTGRRVVAELGRVSAAHFCVRLSPQLSKLPPIGQLPVPPTVPLPAHDVRQRRRGWPVAFPVDFEGPVPRDRCDVGEPAAAVVIRQLVADL